MPANLAVIIGVFGWMLSGCAGSAGPEVLTIQASQYSQAFDAALEAARESGMPAVFRDRRSGVIETDPRISGSLIEPWRTDNEDFAQTVENTVAFQRRRARFEFLPVGYRPGAAVAESQPAATSPDVIGAQQSPIDLTNQTGELELRVWVYVERAETPGIRRSTWTRRETKPSKIITPEGEPPLPDSTFWIPIKRDEAYERRLLDDIQRQLNEGT